MTKETIASYDFEEDAAGLGAFIQHTIDNLPEDTSMVVYVEDAEGRSAVKANFIRNTLTDGSHTVDLILTFA